MKKLRSYEPVWMGTLTGLAALVLWYFSSLAIDKSITPTADRVWPFFSAGFGAFFGSYFAFMFRKHEEKQTKLSRRKTSLNAALFTLLRQYNAMFQIKKMHDAHPTAIDRAFAMPAVKFPEYKDARIDFESLQFLTDAGEINQLIALTIEQERFEAVIQSTEIRNKFHLDTLQPALEKHDIIGRDLLLEDIKKLLGPLIFNTAINSTTSTYELLSQNLTSNRELHQKIWSIAKRLFPSEEFLGPSTTVPASKKNHETSK